MVEQGLPAALFRNSLNTFFRVSTNSGQIESVCCICKRFSLKIFEDEIVSLESSIDILRDFEATKMKFEVIGVLFGTCYFFGLYVSDVKGELSAHLQTDSLATRAKLVDDNHPSADGFVNSVALEPQPLRRAQLLKRGRPWTPDEDELLVKLWEKGMSVEDIDKYFARRTIPALRARYYKLKRDSFRTSSDRETWTLQEEEIPLKLAENDIPWEKIAESVPGKTVKTLKSQYHNLITSNKAPKVRRTKWTTEEDDLLVIALESGMTYEEMSRLLGRGITAVESRLVNLYKNNQLPLELLRGRTYKVADFELMRELREEGIPWKDIAAEHFPGRPVGGMMASYSVYQKKKREEEEEEEEEEAEIGKKDE